MRYFNINMIWYPTPQITHDATHDRAHNSLVWFLSASTQLKFPAVVPCMFLKLLLWSGYVVPHTDPGKRVCGCTMYLAILRFALTAKNVNNTSLVHLSDALCLGVFFGMGNWEKGLGNISFCLNIHWFWWNRNCKYKHANSIKTGFFYLFFFTARRGALVPATLSRLQVW